MVFFEGCDENFLKWGDGDDYTTCEYTPDNWIYPLNVWILLYMHNSSVKPYLKK